MKTELERYLHRMAGAGTDICAAGRERERSLQISTEGFFDAFKDYIKSWKHGKKPSVNGKDLAVVKRALQNNYLNPAWLDKRELVIGEVALKDVMFLDESGDWQRRWGPVNTQRADVAKRNGAVLAKVVAVVKPSVDYINTEKYRTNPYEADSLSDDVYAEKQKTHHFVGLKKKPDTTPNLTLPALDAAGVVKVANAVLTLFAQEEAANYFKTSKWQETFYLGEGLDKPKFEMGTQASINALDGEDGDATTLVELLDELRISVEEEIWARVDDYSWVVFNQLVRELVAWIDASVK